MNAVESRQIDLLMSLIDMRERAILSRGPKRAPKPSIEGGRRFLYGHDFSEISELHDLRRFVESLRDQQ